MPVTLQSTMKRLGVKDATPSRVCTKDKTD